VFLKLRGLEEIICCLLTMVKKKKVFSRILSKTEVFLKSKWGGGISPPPKFDFANCCCAVSFTFGLYSYWIN